MLTETLQLVTNRARAAMIVNNLERFFIIIYRLVKKIVTQFNLSDKIYTLHLFKRSVFAIIQLDKEPL